MTLGAILPFDYTPSKRERERQQMRASEAALKRGLEYVGWEQVARLGPLVMRLPLKTLHAVSLCACARSPIAHV